MTDPEPPVLTEGQQAALDAMPTRGHAHGEPDLCPGRAYLRAVDTRRKLESVLVALAKIERATNDMPDSQWTVAQVFRLCRFAVEEVLDAHQKEKRPVTDEELAEFDQAVAAAKARGRARAAAGDNGSDPPDEPEPTPLVFRSDWERDLWRDVFMLFIAREMSGHDMPVGFRGSEVEADDALLDAQARSPDTKGTLTGTLEHLLAHFERRAAAARKTDYATIHGELARKLVSETWEDAATSVQKAIDE